MCVTVNAPLERFANCPINRVLCNANLYVILSEVAKN